MFTVEVREVGLRQSRMRVSTTDGILGTAREKAPSPVSWSPAGVGGLVEIRRSMFQLLLLPRR